MARPQLTALRLTLTVPCTDAAMSVDCSPSTLTQLIMGLLSTTMRYSAPGSCIALSVDHKDDLVVLSIEDDGSAREHEDSEHTLASEPVWSGLTPVLPLSLETTRVVVDALGGYVESRGDGPQREAAFAIYLPFASPA